MKKRPPDTRKRGKPYIKKRPREITPKQARFVEEYLIDMNAARSARAAGYSPRGASAAGSRVLANVKVQEAIAKASIRRSRKLELTADNVLSRALIVAFGDIRKLVDELGRVRKIHELSEDEQTLVAGFEVNEDGRPFKIKVDGRLKALDLLAKNLGLLKQQVNVSGALTVFDEETIRGLPDDKLDELGVALGRVRTLMGVTS